MNKEEYNDFKRVWLKQYIEQYKIGTKKERTAIKKNIYKNNGLTEDEKDRIWETIIQFGYINEE